MLKAVGVMLALGGAAMVEGRDWTGATTDVGQARQIAPTAESYPIDGFHSAKLGMDFKTARAAAAKDLGIAPEAFTVTEVEPGAITLTATSNTLLPTGPVQVSYRFAKKDGHLSAIFLFWTTGNAPSYAERDAIITRAAGASALYSKYQWRLFSPVVGKPIADDTVIVFAAADDLGNGVEVRLMGAPFTAKMPDGSSQVAPAPTGPTALRVGFVEDIEGRMVLKPGDF